MRTRSVFLLTSVVLPLALAACSGGEGGTNPSGDPDSSVNGSAADAGVLSDGSTGTHDAAAATNDGSPVGTKDSGAATHDGSPVGSGDATVSTMDASSDGGADTTVSTMDASADGGTDTTVSTMDASADSGTDADVTVTDASVDAAADAPARDAALSDGGSDAPMPIQALVTSVGAGVTAVAATINQGTAIGEGSGNGATPATLTDVRADSNNTDTITGDGGVFSAKGSVPDTAAGFCDYPDGGTPKRHSYVTGAKFEASADAATSDPMVPMAPFYFPLVYTSALTKTGNAFGGQAPILGLFDWRPKDIDEAVVVAESDDNGQTWYFMQTVLELNPDYTSPVSGGYSDASVNTGCPTAITGTNASYVSVNGTTADDGWGHAAILQLPGANNAQTGQFLYMLDRNATPLDGGAAASVDSAPLHVINLTGVSNKFPLWNTNNTKPGANDIKSISTALVNTPDSGSPVLVQQTTGLLDPDGIMAVFPTPAGADAGSEVTVLYVQKILSGDTTFPTDQQCTKAPFSGKVNHDVSNVRLATTVDGINFTDHGIVNGLNDPTTVDYNQTRWVSPRGTLLDINGDGSVWGLYFSAGNCLDGDSDAFHFIGYAESTDMQNWTVFNDINRPIASINSITTANQSNGKSVTIPAHPPLIPTESWFAERLYAPTAVQIDSTHLSMTFAGYGVQSPGTDLLNYRQIGNVVLTVSRALPLGVPNNINAH